uniref:Eukaryotic translation initiation factor 4B n=1 Tax=Anas platyrhynchos platyrhynchos TaxID=8840 RepID=A0A493SST9_ANAPP
MATGPNGRWAPQLLGQTPPGLSDRTATGPVGYEATQPSPPPPGPGPPPGTTGPPRALSVRAVSTAWHSNEDDVYRAPPIDRSILPTAPRAAREPNIDRSRLPKCPPYTAFLGNLPYDVTEDSIKDFFRGLNISAVRLPREPTNPERLKGFGYAEFEDIDSLFQALSLNEEIATTAASAGTATASATRRGSRATGGPGPPPPTASTTTPRAGATTASVTVSGALGGIGGGSRGGRPPAGTVPGLRGAPGAGSGPWGCPHGAVAWIPSPRVASQGANFPR